MGKESRERLDQYRRSEAGEVENTLIDELVSGELDRSEFLRRPNVKFQSGQKFGADDVVATYERLVGKDSAALSAFSGVLSPGGAKRIDDLTVLFTLDAPNANFPYLTSSTTYQAIILPADYKLEIGRASCRERE